jgi:hypothetical protein
MEGDHGWGIKELKKSVCNEKKKTSEEGRERVRRANSLDA